MDFFSEWMRTFGIIIFGLACIAAIILAIWGVVYVTILLGQRYGWVVRGTAVVIGFVALVSFVVTLIEQ